MFSNTLSCELLPPMNSAEGVVNAARVSFAKDASQFTAEENAKLLKYLYKHKHWAPFGHAREGFTFALYGTPWLYFLENANLAGFAWQVVAARVFLSGSVWAWHENLCFLESNGVADSIRKWFHENPAYDGLNKLLFKFPKENSVPKGELKVYHLRDIDTRDLASLASVSFRVRAPIFVARQLVKHQQQLCWNEVSRRYVKDAPELFLPDKWRHAPEKSVKQGSGEEFELRPSTRVAVEAVCEHNVALYNMLLDEDVAAEMARMVLPVSQMTEWVWTGSVRAFKRVCNERLDPHAQAETREVAKLIDSQMLLHCPIIWKSLSTEPPYIERG